MTDEEIVKLFYDRNESAIKALSDKYGAKIKAAAYDVLKNEQDAEECVNDAYLAVWNSVPPQKPENICAYACGVVHNVAMKRYRYNTAEKRSAQTVSLDAELSEIIADESGGDNGLDEAINGFLKSLSKKNRILFMRRYYYEDSISDIAGLSGMNENAVAARLFRIRAKLSAYLKKEGFTI